MTYKNSFVLAGFSVLAALLILGAAAISLPSHASAKTLTDSSGKMVSISASGDVLVRGATVTDVTGSLIEAETSWGDTVISWDVETDGSTDFYSKGSAESSLSDIDEGDQVSFSGSLDRDDGAFSVDADVVRNWSLDSLRSMFVGIIESIDDAHDSFVLETKGKGEITVTTDGDTDFMIRGEQDADFDDLSVGNHVAVTGSFDGDDTLDASKISMSLRALPLGNAWGFWKNWGADFSAKIFGHTK